MSLCDVVQLTNKNKNTICGDKSTSPLDISQILSFCFFFILFLLWAMMGTQTGNRNSTATAIVRQESERKTSNMWE